MRICTHLNVSLQLNSTGESMKSEYNQRGKQLLRDMCAIIFNHKTLIIIPIVSNLMIICMAYGIIHPVINYEKMQLQLKTSTTEDIVMAYVAIFFLLYCRNVIKAFGMAALTIAIDNKNKAIKTSVLSTLIPVSWKIFRTITFLSFFGVIYRFIDLVLSFNSKRKLFGGSTTRYSHIILIPLVIFSDPMPTYKALQEAGKLTTETWGKPPLKLGFSFISISFLALITCLTPALITLSLSSQPNAIVWLSIGLSCCLYLIYSAFHQATVHYINYALYQYAKYGDVTYPMPRTTLKSALISIITNESLNHKTS
jgi:hypothetical protein